MGAKKIVILGGINTDMVMKSASLPAPGETVVAEELIQGQGGKGANQAVAVARLGGEAVFAGQVGKDAFGASCIASLKSHGIDTSYLMEDQHAPTGMALIMVDKRGENVISVFLGANNTLTTEIVDRLVGIIRDAAFVLVQLEIPMAVVTYLVQVAHQLGTEVVLNPAPALDLPDGLLKGLYMITPNETEAHALTGITVDDQFSAHQAAAKLRDRGVKQVIITMGAKGAYVQSDDLDELVEGVPVTAVDSTAAGDTFNGALVVGLSEGKSIPDAIRFANQAAALSVTRAGAQSSIPIREELEKFQQEGF